MPEDRSTVVALRTGRTVRMHSREAGEGGRPLVLVHGLGMSGRSMRPAMARLSADRRVFAPDLPGHGRSRRAPRALGVPGLSDALEGWLGALQLTRVDLVGHSLGAQVVGDLARRRPDLVASLVLCGPTPDPGAPTAAGQARRLLRDAPRERPALWPVAATDYLRAGPLAMLVVLRHAVRRPEEHAMHGVEVRTLVLRGARDPIAGMAWCTELADALPCGSLQVVDGAPHGLPFSAPDAFAAAVAGFCR